jgi:hypothetical protein
LSNRTSTSGKTARLEQVFRQRASKRRREKPKKVLDEPLIKPVLAFGGVVHAAIRDRWQSARPFAGHTDDSLHRKAVCRALTKRTKEEIQRELVLRGS